MKTPSKLHGWPEGIVLFGVAEKGGGEAKGKGVGGKNKKKADVDGGGQGQVI